MRLSSLVSVLLAAACIAASGRAGADEAASARAAREFLHGQQAFEASDFRAAGQAFEAAYAAKPHYDALFNAGQSWQRAGAEIRAANLLDRYLHEAPGDAPDRAVAENLLADVARRAGRVRLERTDVRQPAIDGEPVGSGVFFVSPGEHVFTGETTQGPLRTVFRVDPGRLTDMSSVTGGRPDVPVTALGASPADHARGGAALSPWVVAVGGGLVGIGAATTTVFGLDAVSRRDAYLQDRTQARYDAVADAQSRTNVTLYTTLGLAVVTGVVALLFVDWRSPVRRATSVSATATRGGRTDSGEGSRTE
jgi:hypothetical protein